MTTTIRRCQGCGRDLPLLARPDRRFHGAACRQRGARERDRVAVKQQNPLDDLQLVLLRALDEERLVAYIATQGTKPVAGSCLVVGASLPLALGLAAWRRRGRACTRAGPLDPFAEVDQLAARRRERLGARGDAG